MSDDTTTTRRLTPSERTHELALALATKQPRERSTTTTITNDNAKHAIHSTIQVTDPDSSVSFDTAADLMQRSLERFGDPRENGATT